MYFNRALDRFYHGEGTNRAVSTPRHRRAHTASFPGGRAAGAA
jgi:hypothetical protein